MELVSQEAEINRRRIGDRRGKMITWKNNKRGKWRKWKRKERKLRSIDRTIHWLIDNLLWKADICPACKQILLWPAAAGVMTEWIWVLLRIPANPEARQPRCLCSWFSSLTIGKSRYWYLKLWQIPFPFTRSGTRECPTAGSPPLDKSNVNYNTQFGLKPICSGIIPFTIVCQVICSQIYLSGQFRTAEHSCFPH